MILKLPFQRVAIHDRWFRLLGVPFIAYMSHVIFFNENHGVADEAYSTWQVFLISVVEAMILWEGNRLVLVYYRSRYPEICQSRQRIIGQLIGCMMVTILIRYLNVWIYDKTLFWGYIFPPEGYLYSIFVGLLYVMIFAGIYEGLYYFHKWKIMFAEAEALKRENLQTQFDSLKAQVNPHFLFNNLSSLSSLIIEDQQKAVVFVRELSSVYRYLLQANQKNLVTLAEEMKFVGDYFHLLKTRFGDGIQLKTALMDGHEQYWIPPLTLQLLIENAVKHNAVSPENPLWICIISNEDGRLAILNNKRPKSSVVISDKLGLKTIQSKYALMNQGEVEIKQADDAFEVSIPLIKNNIYEAVDSGR